MRTEQSFWSESGWSPQTTREEGLRPDLVLVFGGRPQLESGRALAEIRTAYPGAFLFGASTAGEIQDTQVSDACIAVTAVEFERTAVRHAIARLSDVESSYEAGVRLAQSLPRNGLVHVLVLSDGLQVNGSELVQGLENTLPAGVSITGGLAGDADLFERTVILFDDQIGTGIIGAVGLYGDHLRVGYGSLGGWDSFGPERLVTRSKGNVLYELDGKSALELYENYLGEHAQGLPATGLLFPLSLRRRTGETPVVRTILGVDRPTQSMTFAGDMPVGSYARLMKANFDRLIDGAVGAAKVGRSVAGTESPELAILISCVGRKMVLKQRIEEEVEGVREVLGNRPALTGFYSYGEISPFTPLARCELHNQTMTITTFSEEAA